MLIYHRTYPSQSILILLNLSINTCSNNQTNIYNISFYLVHINVISWRHFSFSNHSITIITSCLSWSHHNIMSSNPHPHITILIIICYYYCPKSSYVSLPHLIKTLRHPHNIIVLITIHYDYCPESSYLSFSYHHPQIIPHHLSTLYRHHHVIILIISSHSLALISTCKTNN